jgi:hypothetical protein
LLTPRLWLTRLHPLLQLLHPLLRPLLRVLLDHRANLGALSLTSFIQVRRETVWKLAGRDEWHVSWRHEAPKKGSFRTVLWAQGTTKRSLHGVSRQSLEGVFSEVRIDGVLGSPLRVGLLLDHRLCWLRGGYGLCVSVHNLPGARGHRGSSHHSAASGIYPGITHLGDARAYAPQHTSAIVRS